MQQTEVRTCPAHQPVAIPEADLEPMWPLWLSAGLSLLLLVAAWAAENWFGQSAWLAITLYSLSYLAGGYLRVVAGVSSLKEGKLDINMLMVLGAAGAAVLGKWAEGGFLMFLFALSAALEAYATGRTRRAIHALVELRPDTARLKTTAGEQQVRALELRPGDVVIVRPGDRVPVDGTVVRGQSAVDQAAITGESMPVTKGIDSPVYAGTLNGSGLLEVRVAKRVTESTLARIIASVEEAQEHKAKSQRLTDWIDRYYTLMVIGIATLSLLLPPLFGWDDWHGSFYRAMTLLVVMSPCALVISTPAALLSAIARAARAGILFKGGAHLERAGLVQVVAVDKTGTLTAGKPSVTDLLPTAGVRAEELLLWTASAEAHSGHPLARAIVAAAAAQNLQLLPASDLTETPGLGVEGYVEGLGSVHVGSKQLLADDPDAERWLQQIAPLEEAGKTVVVVRRGCGVAGCVALADTLRESSPLAVRSLKAQGVKRVVMLTGDNARTAAAIGHAAGVDEVAADLLPQDKLRAIQRLGEIGPVAMVGDGVNDAPALAAASLGIAIGGAGNDAAIETADVVLMADDLRKVTEAIAIGKAARRVVVQNLTFAVLVILSLVTLTLLGRLNLPFAVVGHEGSTILVAFNGLRMLVYRPRL